jgi:hypothetical protein
MHDLTTLYPTGAKNTDKNEHMEHLYLVL